MFTVTAGMFVANALPTPMVLTPDATDMNNQALVSLTSSRIYFCPVTVFAAVTVTQMRCPSPLIFCFCQEYIGWHGWIRVLMQLADQQVQEPLVKDHQ